jgi:hypothetical protein
MEAHTHCKPTIFELPIYLVTPCTENTFGNREFKTTLTSYDFNFIIAILNDASLEIRKKQEDKKEEVLSQINNEIQGVQQELQSSCTISTMPLTIGIPELGDEPAQLLWIIDTFEAHLRRAQGETTQATQALAQVQKDLED